MVTPILGAGTGESQWRGWHAVGSWPSLDIPQGITPLVVAPHPDDEILGVGGLIALLGQVEIVAVTDGEGSHPQSTVYAPARLAEIRSAETGRALQRLGVGGAEVHRLGHLDGGIDETALTATLTGLLSPERWCLATWAGDGHPDHEAVGRAAAAACTAAGAVLWEYPIWTWHWAQPGDGRVPWDRARRIDLPLTAQRAKAAAVDEFHSQIAAIGPDSADAAILPPAVLARFARPYEVVFA